MAKEKKYKGGPDRKSYLASMARGPYMKYGDFSEKDVHDKDITYSHRGSSHTIKRNESSVPTWVNELVNREGKGVGDAFRHGGSLYKIVAGHRPGAYTAERVLV